MVDYNLIKNLDVDDSAVERELMAAFSELPDSQKIEQAIDETIGSFQAGHILAGKVVGIVGDDVIVDVGLKSEGVIPLNEWSDKSSIEPGDPVEVLLEAIESDSGVVLLSKRKADRIRGWERLISTTKEGDTVTGVVTRKIKGGLLVDIGVPAFLPASQVDIRRPADIGEYIGKQIEAKILKIDTDRRNIVIAQRVQKQADGRVGGRSTSQRSGQEPRRLRRFHRPGRYRRLAAHHRYELGAHQSSLGYAPDRRGGGDQDT